MKKASRVVVVVLLIGIGALFVFAPAYVERRMNKVRPPPVLPVSARAMTLHKQLLIADLHADSLLWGRDLLTRSARGQVDVPRLIAGNVAVQAFTIVTQSPRHLNIEANDATTDTIIWLVIAERYPLAAWRRLNARARYQARRLHDVADRFGGRFTVIQTAADLRAYLERRKTTTEITAGFLGVEGAHALDGDLDNVEVLFTAGIRMMAPTHFFDNDIAGSAHGLKKSGLTPKGKALIRRMESLKMIVDLAHASPRTIDDVLAIATRPVVVSHAGVKGTCNNTRNLNDAQLRAIAANGGLIGIGFWSTAICGRDAKAVAQAIHYAARVAGIDHVALGSDFDGAVTMPFDATGLVRVTDALLAARFSVAEIESVMGGNAIRFLEANLP